MQKYKYYSSTSTASPLNSQNLIANGQFTSLGNTTTVKNGIIANVNQETRDERYEYLLLLFTTNEKRIRSVKNAFPDADGGITQ